MLRLVNEIMWIQGFTSTDHIISIQYSVAEGTLATREPRLSIGNP